MPDPNHTPPTPDAPKPGRTWAVVAGLSALFLGAAIPVIEPFVLMLLALLPAGATRAAADPPLILHAARVARPAALAVLLAAMTIVALAR